MSERMDVVCKKPIVYGSMSFYQGKKADEANQHRWSCYVRSVDEEDISVFIQKVVFNLHPSFPNPVRSIERPPFEIQESGWGEFEITMQIFFKDSRERRVDIFHMLKLYPSPSGSSLSTKRPVISEFYEEVVFYNPYPEFHSILQGNGTPTPPNQEILDSQFHQDMQSFYQPPNDQVELKKIEEAYAFIEQQRELLKDHLRTLEEQINASRIELREEERKLSEVGMS